MVMRCVCAYHAQLCTNTEAHDGGKVPRIKAPNELALCAECYYEEVRRHPAPLEKHTCPGAQEIKPDAIIRIARAQDQPVKTVDETTEKEKKYANGSTFQKVAYKHLRECSRTKR